MKRIAVKAASSAALLATLLTSTVVFAQGGAPSSLQLQHQAQRFDSTSVVSASSAAIDTEAINMPGPYARYLMYTGVSLEDAMKAARDIDKRQQAASASVIRHSNSSDSLHGGVSALHR